MDRLDGSEASARAFVGADNDDPDFSTARGRLIVTGPIPTNVNALRAILVTPP